MSLDAALGDGATQMFQEAMTLGDGDTQLFFSDWEHEPAPSVPVIEDGLVVVQTMGDEHVWPGDGVWRLATVVWGDGISQQAFFKDGVIAWGNGLCSNNGGIQGESLRRLASPEMRDFLDQYIDEMLISLPNLERFYTGFLLAGFVMKEQHERSVVVSNVISPSSRVRQMIEWHSNGADPSDEPAWRTDLRAEIGLEELFPPSA